MSDDVFYRRLNLSTDNIPKTLDESSRTVGIIISTTTPVVEFDARTQNFWPTSIIPEGVEVPSNGQVPYMDTHDTGSVENQIGSVRSIKAEGDNLNGVAHFASDEKSLRAFNLAKEGHLTDNSIQYRALEKVYVEDGELAEVAGRSFEGPVIVVTKSRMIEVSAVAVGADPNAKNRAASLEQPEENKTEVEETKRMSEENKEAKAETVVEAPVERQVDTEAVERAAQDAVKVERARVSEIEGIARQCNLDSEFIGKVENESVEDFKARALDALSKKHEEVNVNSPQVVVKEDAVDKFRSAASDAILLKAGKLDTDNAERTQIAHEVAGNSLEMMARELLRLRGENHLGSIEDVFKRSLATSDFPILTSNLANKSVKMGWDMANETYESWVDTNGSVANYKLQTKARAGEFSDLLEVKEGEEYKNGDRPEEDETFQLAKYGRLISFTREMLINDDLSQLTDNAQTMGEAARRKLGDLCYSVLTTNPTMGDGTALFDAAHGNIGTTGKVNATTMGEAIKLMKYQKDIGGKRRLNIKPAFLLAPAAIEGEAEEFFQSRVFADSSTDATRTNIYYNSVNRVYETRLDDDSLTAWYLAAARNTVQLAFLNGNKAPYLERQDAFKTDSVDWKVRIEAVAWAMNWKGLLYNAGA
jgi:hypothetical protein